jgi:membrane-associated phospholipid phosphatase
MSSPLLRWLALDLNKALTDGVRRDPAASVDGARWLTAAASVLVLAGLGLYLSSGYHAGFATLNSWAAVLPPWTWEWLTMLGDERVAFALVLFFARRHPRLFWTLLCAGLLAAAYSRGLKPLVDAARPPKVLDPGSFRLIGPAHRNHSFPSGHSVTAGVFFGVMIYYARSLHWRVLFLALAVLGGLSRVALGVHWPADVAAGLAGGLLVALGGVWIAQRSRWAMRDPSIHLACVCVAMVMAVGLLLDDGGYHHAARMLQILGASALLAALASYLLLPVQHWRKRRPIDSAGGEG